MAVGAKLFVRQSSGLVRAVSAFDAFVYNLLWLNIGLGVGVTFILAPFLYPGGDIILATVVVTIFAAIHCAVWALLAGAMPRSGGDYVFVSRSIHPAIGFLNNWTITILNVMTMVLAAHLFVSDGLSTALAIMGSATGSKGLTDISATILEPLPQFLIGGGAIVVLTAVMIFFGLGYFRIQRVLFAIGVLGVLLAAGLLLFSSHEAVSSRLDALYGANAIQRTIAAAAAAGAPAATPTLGAFLGVMAITLFTMPWSFASAWIGGEVRHPGRSQMLAMVGSVVVGGASIVILGWLLLSRVGEDLLAASGFLFFTGGASPIAAPPYYHFWPSILTTNTLVAGLIAIGFITWTFLWIPINLLSGSRNIFAWAFDRLVPARLADVDDRTQTPLIALAIVGLLALVMFGVYAFTGVYFLTSFLAASMFSLMVLDIAAIVTAYRRPDLLQRAPQALRRIAGVPLIVLLASIAAIFFAVMLWFMLTDSVFGANSPAAFITWGVSYVTGAALWFGARAWHRRRDGYDIAGLYQVLPPE
jgi:basic amino acid/polyamine antiporter, APA family